jgi:hypothetical protein
MDPFCEDLHTILLVTYSNLLNVDQSGKWFEKSWKEKYITLSHFSIPME